MQPWMFLAHYTLAARFFYWHHYPPALSDCHSTLNISVVKFYRDSCSVGIVVTSVAYVREVKITRKNGNIRVSRVAQSGYLTFTTNMSQQK